MGEQDWMQKIREWLKGKKNFSMKKSDWVVLALIGVLILILAMPSSGSNSRGGGNSLAESNTSGGVSSTSENDAPEPGSGTYGSNAQNNGADAWTDAYVEGLEERLEQILSQMDGVGEVEVMITVADAGEVVVEKDSTGTTSTTTESDSSGGNRTITEGETGTSTVYVETEDGTYPYIRKEKMPTIIGVVVVAEGGGNPTVVSNISNAVESLFSVEAHRITVVKMSSKEDGR